MAPTWRPGSMATRQSLGPTRAPSTRTRGKGCGWSPARCNCRHTTQTRISRFARSPSRLSIEPAFVAENVSALPLQLVGHRPPHGADELDETDEEPKDEEHEPDDDAGDADADGEERAHAAEHEGAGHVDDHVAHERDDLH